MDIFVLLMDIIFLFDSNMHIDLCGRSKLNPTRQMVFMFASWTLPAMLNLPECGSATMFVCGQH